MMRVRLAAASDADAIGRVQVETWRATYDGILLPRTLAALSANASADRWRTTLLNPASLTHIHVVEGAAGEVVGFAAAGPERSQHPDYQGEIYALYISPAAQRGGCGRALVRAAAGDLVERGLHSLLIWVLRDNATGCGFYRAIGGRAVLEKTITIDGQVLPEVGYVWTDLPGWLLKP